MKRHRDGDAGRGDLTTSFWAPSPRRPPVPRDVLPQILEQGKDARGRKLMKPHLGFP